MQARGPSLLGITVLLPACWSFELPCGDSGVCASCADASPCPQGILTSSQPPSQSRTELRDASADASPEPAAATRTGCGAPHQPCCADGSLCGAGLLCNGTTGECERCGQFIALEPLAAQAASNVLGVSAEGTVAYGSSSSPQRAERAVRWVSGSSVARALAFRLGGTDLLSSRAVAASADGSILVGWGRPFSGNGDIALVWRPQLGRLTQGQAVGVSADGQVVVGTTLVGSDAFRWTRGSDLQRLQKMTTNGRVGGYLQANAVSSDGEVIVGEGDTGLNARRAFRWTRGGGATPLGVLAGGSESYASSASAEGDIVVGASESAEGWHWFRWSVFDATPVPIASRVDEAVPPRTNASGDRVVGARAEVASVWSAQWQEVRAVQEALDAEVPEGWSLREATGISGDGEVLVGNGVDPEGQRRGWLAVLGRVCPPQAFPEQGENR